MRTPCVPVSCNPKYLKSEKIIKLRAEYSSTLHYAAKTKYFVLVSHARQYWIYLWMNISTFLISFLTQLTLKRQNFMAVGCIILVFQLLAFFPCWEGKRLFRVLCICFYICLRVPCLNFWNWPTLTKFIITLSLCRNKTNFLSRL